MKKKLKGMTLVELVVAIAILGLGSTMLVTAFAQVSLVNRENHQFNERMSNQIKMAENQAKSGAGVTATQQKVTIKVVGGANFNSSSPGYELCGDACWVDIPGTTDDSGNDTDRVQLDYKYFNVLVPPQT